jgi:hypothetical protein
MRLTKLLFSASAAALIVASGAPAPAAAQAKEARAQKLIPVEITRLPMG